MAASTLPATHRECNACGKAYDVIRKGKGGSLASDRDRELFPFRPNIGIGVRAERPHWLHGAFCSDACYAWNYAE